MKTIVGTLARRLLVNWRIDAQAAGRCLPAGVRPILVRGYAIAGLCIVRLERVRPAGIPEWLSLNSENVAARMAVECNGRPAVLIFRRDTGSWINAFAGGRFFPGIHHRATFLIHEDARRVALSMRSADGMHTIDIAAEESGRIMPNSVFDTLDDAVAFFRAGENGYCPGKREGEWDGVKLACKTWELAPMQIEHVAASFIEDTVRFPRGSAELDSAFIMRGTEHEWTALPPLAWGRVPRSELAEKQERALA